MLPPNMIPDQLFNEYTINGKIPVQYQYFNDTACQARVYSKELVEAMILAANARQTHYYGITDQWLYQALDTYDVAGKNTVVYGSQLPWYESICLSRGAKCTTIEYQKIESLHSGIKTITPAQYEKSPVLFDAALSISSFEHDGLGRYGEPLNPNGDIEAMNRVKAALVPGGLLFLAVPCATTDVLVWNANRVYGPRRLPLLLKGWNFLFMFGDIYTGEPGKFSQPVFVLAKP